MNRKVLEAVFLIMITQNVIPALNNMDRGVRIARGFIGMARIGGMMALYPYLKSSAVSQAKIGLGVVSHAVGSYKRERILRESDSRSQTETKIHNPEEAAELYRVLGIFAQKHDE